MKTVFLKHISDCLRCGKVGGDAVDEVNGLNSTIKPFSVDLIDNRLLVIRERLNKWPPFAVFLVFNPFLFDPSNGRLP